MRLYFSNCSSPVATSIKLQNSRVIFLLQTNLQNVFSYFTELFRRTENFVKGSDTPLKQIPLSG